MVGNTPNTIYRDRGAGIVRLNVGNDVMSPTGTFCCVVPVAGGESIIIKRVCAVLGK